MASFETDEETISRFVTCHRCGSCGEYTWNVARGDFSYHCACTERLQHRGIHTHPDGPGDYFVRFDPAKLCIQRRAILIGRTILRSRSGQLFRIRYVVRSSELILQGTDKRVWIINSAYCRTGESFFEDNLIGPFTNFDEGFTYLTGQTFDAEGGSNV